MPSISHVASIGIWYNALRRSQVGSGQGMEGPRGMQHIHGQCLEVPGLQELEALLTYVAMRQPASMRSAESKRSAESRLKVEMSVRLIERFRRGRPRAVGPISLSQQQR